MNHPVNVSPDRFIRPAWSRPLGLLCAGLLLGLAVWSARHQPPAAPPRELSRTNLVHRAGIWYEAGQTNPFTGVMVEFYHDGAPLSRSALSNGLLNGLSEGWYTNRQLQIRETYRDNFSEGVRTKWYPNGNKLSEATVVHGRFAGLFRRWHQNGRLAEEIPMTDGRPEGLGRSYYESGAVRAEVRLQAGKEVDRKTFPDAPAAGSGPGRENLTTNVETTNQKS